MGYKMMGIPSWPFQDLYVVVISDQPDDSVQCIVSVKHIADTVAKSITKSSPLPESAKNNISNARMASFTEKVIEKTSIKSI